MLRTAALFLCLASLLWAARQAFEVASLKPSLSDKSPAVGMSPGRLTASNVPLRTLITVAWKIRPFQLVGGPGWIASEKYNIEAKTDASNGADPMLLMLQSLLEERFKLVVHRETREGPVYFLVIAKGGIKMHAATCKPFDTDDLRRDVAAEQQAPGSLCNGMERRADGPNQSFDAAGIGMEDPRGPAYQGLAGQLSLYLDRPVVNKTGLAGLFDVHLHWTSDQAPAGSAGQMPTLANTDGPSIFTALEEQVGLKLESARGPVDYLVIDRVDKPVEN